MKKFFSILVAICLMFVFTIPSFADSVDTGKMTFKKLFESNMPQYKLESAEYEAGEQYVLFVSTPISQQAFKADEGAFEGVRGTIVEEDIVAVNAEIISIEEDEEFNYNITFIPEQAGEFSFAINMRVFGFDIIGDGYRTIEGDDWVYAFQTETYTALPSSKPIESSFTESSTDTQSLDESSQATSSASTSSAIKVDVEPDAEISVWVWVVLGAIVVAGAVVLFVLNRKKLIK